MNWRWLRAFPKFALVVILILGSSIGFYAWWRFHSFKKAFYEERPLPVEDVAPKMANIESSWHNLLLVDNDLYDAESGELLFSKWLKHGMPMRLFWQADSKTLLAHYERGFVRYKPDGSVDAELPNVLAAAVADDYKWVVFSRGGDIHKAEIDWPGMKLVNERKVTSTGVFNDLNFAGSILLGTDRTLLVRSVNQLLRVSLETGTHQPIRLPVENLGKRRSPNQKSVAGIQNGEFYCYDVDSDTAKSTKVGRVAFNDCQWLDNDRCAVLGGGKAVVLYDRQKHTLTEVVALPQFCNRIGEPSPDGRFVFCGAQGKTLMVDIQEKTARPVSGSEGARWIANDTYLLARDTTDSELRGIWLQKMGENERRISAEPYIVGRSGPMIMERRSAGLHLFATKRGLSKMKKDGTDVAEVATPRQRVKQAIGIEEWNL